MIDPGLLFVCFPPQKDAGLRGQGHAQYAVACVDWQKQSVRKCVFLLPCACRYKGGIRSETAAAYLLLYKMPLSNQDQYLMYLIGTPVCVIEVILMPVWELTACTTSSFPM